MLAVSSTFAGNLTLVGSVANLIVAQGAKNECPLSFWSFLRIGAITTIVTTLVAVAVLYSYHLLNWI
jgi:Na+/H+ antiporter NhaD/arsenite permease-like protein